MKSKRTETFLGVVQRDMSIFIPWRGSHFSWEHDFPIGQVLLVELAANSPFTKVVSVDLPTLQQLKEMKEELEEHWSQFTEVFKQSPMEKQVLMLRMLSMKLRAGDVLLYVRVE